MFTYLLQKMEKQCYQRKCISENSLCLFFFPCGILDYLVSKIWTMTKYKEIKIILTWIRRQWNIVIHGWIILIWTVSLRCSNKEIHSHWLAFALSPHWWLSLISFFFLPFAITFNFGHTNIFFYMNIFRPAISRKAVDFLWQTNILQCCDWPFSAFR